MAKGSAKEFGEALQAVRAEFGMTQIAIHQQAGIPQPMLSSYMRGRSLPQSETFERLVLGLRNLRVPEDRLTTLREVWEGKSSAPPSPSSPADATPPAPAPIATAPEVTPTPRPAPLGITIRDAEGGGWVLTAVIPATFPEVRLGEISASVRAVLARIVGS